MEFPERGCKVSKAKIIEQARSKTVKTWLNQRFKAIVGKPRRTCHTGLLVSKKDSHYKWKIKN